MARVAIGVAVAMENEVLSVMETVPVHATANPPGSDINHRHSYLKAVLGVRGVVHLPINFICFNLYLTF